MTPEQCRAKAEEIVRPYMSMDHHGPDYIAMVRAVMGLLYETAAVSESFSVIAEDQNDLCDGLNKILDAHGVEWDEETNYANAFSGIIARLTAERDAALAQCRAWREEAEAYRHPDSEHVDKTGHILTLRFAGECLDFLLAARANTDRLLAEQSNGDGQ